MKVSMRWCALPLVVLLAACPRDTTDGEVAITDETAAPPAPEMGAPQTTPQMGQAGMQTARLQPVQGSGVSGEARFTGRGDRTEIMVEVSGAPANASLPGHVHSGTCQNIGSVQQPLDAIDTDAAGSGSVTSTVDLAPAMVMDGQHVVVYHGEGGTPITCAQITASAM